MPRCLFILSLTLVLLEGCLVYTDLQVHVVVRGNEVTFVLHSPLQLGNDRFTGKAVQIRLGVDGHRLQGEKYSSGVSSNEIERLTAMVAWG